MEDQVLHKPEAVWLLEDENMVNRMESTVTVKMEPLPDLKDEFMLTHIKEELDTVSDSEGASFDLKPVKKEFCEAEEDEPEDGSAHTSDGGQDMCCKLEIEDNNILEDSSGCRQSTGLGGLQVRHNIAGSSVEAAVHPEPDIEIPLQKENYECCYCDMFFSRVVDLVQHTNISHTGAKPFKCEYCGRGFRKICDLNAHIRTHTGEKPYSCEYCNKCFRYSSILIAHKRTHTREKPFSCEHCNKYFAHSSGLFAHRRMHTGAKPYSCEYCKKCFTNTSALIVHRRTHTGEKPFSCEHCNKCFTNTSALIVHRRTHTGEKPFSCEHCNKCFTQRSALNYHVRTH